jgi:hypothetical protein
LLSDSSTILHNVANSYVSSYYSCVIMDGWRNFSNWWSSIIKINLQAMPTCIIHHSRLHNPTMKPISEFAETCIKYGSSHFNRYGRNVCSIYNYADTGPGVLNRPSIIAVMIYINLAILNRPSIIAVILRKGSIRSFRAIVLRKTPQCNAAIIRSNRLSALSISHSLICYPFLAQPSYIS